MPRTFERLYETWHRPMLYVAEQILQDHHLAEDAVQNALFRISRQKHCLPSEEKAPVQTCVDRLLVLSYNPK